ncbi:MAG: AbrB/MazE/SpoVT family DNA-binding domain-containing protein [Propionibacteriaceae bacterium]|nr:AbrB/MazE/SpoVT family DNA-binding domain-containing protein [Propionibacteriaceae bacterium]
MTSLATVTSKGQVTLPRAVRQALSIESGDLLTFTLTDRSVIVEKSLDFMSLAGSIAVPSNQRGVAWEDALDHARRARGER